MLFRILLPVAILCLSSAPARAQNDTGLAQRYYKLGEELYNRSAYEEALAQFKKSYEYSQKPALLYNMARGYESLGRHEKAAEFYSRYLKHNPPNAKMIKVRITNLQRLAQRKKKPQPVPQPAPQPKPASQPVAQPVVAQPATQPTPPQPTPQPSPAEPKPQPVMAQPTPQPGQGPAPKSRTMWIAGWTMVGVGGAGLIAGLVLGGLAADKASWLEDQSASLKVEYADIKDEEALGRSLQTGQIVGLAAGGAIAATGVVLLILDSRKKPAERRAWLAPAISPEGALVSAGVRF